MELTFNNTDFANAGKIAAEKLLLKGGDEILKKVKVS
jgi:hypothetical protein